MGRNKLDLDKEKKIATYRIDDRDKEKLKEVFGSVQKGIDVLILMTEIRTPTLKGYADLLDEVRRLNMREE